MALSPEQILATIGDGILVLAPDWTVIHANGQAEAVLGRPAAEFLGRNWWGLFPSLAGTPTDSMLRRAAASGQPAQVEHFSQRRGRWYHAKAYPSGLGITLCFTDVTELRAERDRQQINHDRFALAARNRVITLYEQDVDLRYTWLYPLHPEHAHALGKTDAELSADETARQLIAMKRRAMETGAEQRMEVSVRLPDGGRHFYDTIAVPRRNDLGEVVGVAGAAFNVTERRLAEEALAAERQRSAAELENLVKSRTASLQEAIQQMEEFSYSVSHDLRAPLRAMLSYAEIVLAEHGAGLTPEARDYIERIRRNAERMDALVRDSLAYSRISRRDIVLGPVSLDRLVADAISNAQASGTAARFEVVPPLGAVFGHELSLGQAVSNLLNNATKFVRPGVVPQVRIHSSSSDGRRRLQVTDNGIGIPPALQPRLFQMFERLNVERTFEGTGIGLAIVRKAVERMGGQVGVISDGSQGSTFWIELPAAPGS